MPRPSPILVVSRDLHVQDSYVHALRECRVAVHGVATCGDAVDFLRFLSVRAIVVDVGQPTDWEGCRLLYRITPRDVPLLVLTSEGASDPEFKRLAQDAGCAGFVAKACPPRILLDALERLEFGDAWVECVSASAYEGLPRH